MVLAKKGGERSGVRSLLHFCLGYRDYQSLFLVGRNPCDGSRVVSNILRIPRERHCCHCDLVVKRGTNSLKVLFHVLKVFDP